MRRVDLVDRRRLVVPTPAMRQL